MSERCAPRDTESLSQNDNVADPLPYSDCCRLVSRSSVGSKWEHLVTVLAELEARQSSPARHPAASVRNPDDPRKDKAG